jgi:hypothetical protein
VRQPLACLISKARHAGSRTSPNKPSCATPSTLHLQRQQLPFLPFPLQRIAPPTSAHIRLLLSFRSFRFVGLVQLLIMRLPRSSADAAVLSTFIFPFLASANVLNCAHVQADSVSWDFESLGGPKSVLHSVENSASWTNTTYTIDLCVPLKRKNDVPDDQKCPGGTQCKLFKHTAPSCRYLGSANQK